MVKISSKEAESLHKNYGINYGDGGISVHGRFKTRGKSHYLCESSYNMKCLQEVKNGKRK